MQVWVCFYDHRKSCLRPHTQLLLVTLKSKDGNAFLFIYLFLEMPF